MAVIVSTTIVSFYSLHHAGVSIVGVIPGGLPAPSLPELDVTLAKELLPAAFLISIVGFVETVSLVIRLPPVAAKRISRTKS